MFKAVVFDMDGVIADSEPLHFEAERLAVLKFGADVQIEKLQEFIGMTAHDFLVGLIKKYDINATVDQLYEAKFEIFDRLIRERVEPVKGVLDFMHALVEKSFRLAIVSSSKRYLIDIVLAKFGIEGLFEVIVGAEDVSRGKPDPQPYALAAERLLLKPEECVAIEDAYFGVLSAKAAGMKCVGLRSTHSGNQDLSAADLVVSSFAELEASGWFNLD